MGAWINRANEFNDVKKGEKVEACRKAGAEATPVCQTFEQQRCGLLNKDCRREVAEGLASVGSYYARCNYVTM